MSVKLTINGETFTAYKWSVITGKCQTRILRRKRAGYPDEQCVFYKTSKKVHCLTVNGVTMTAQEWSAKTGIPFKVIRNRIYAGMSDERCVALSPRKQSLVTFKGLTLPLMDWSRRLGIPYRTLWHRHAHGLPPERILSKEPRVARKNAAILMANGATLTLAEWSIKTGIPLRTLESRRRRGLTPDRILETKGVHYQHLTYGGVSWTVMTWARALNVSHKTINSRINKGWTTEECLFGRPGRSSISKPPVNTIMYEGKARTFAEWAELTGLHIDKIRSRFQRGWDPKDILGDQPRGRARLPRNGNVVEYNGKSQTLAEWAKELGVTYHTLYARKARGGTPEKILSPGLS